GDGQNDAAMQSAVRNIFAEALPQQEGPYHSQWQRDPRQIESRGLRLLVHGRSLREGPRGQKAEFGPEGTSLDGRVDYTAKTLRVAKGEPKERGLKPASG